MFARDTPDYRARVKNIIATLTNTKLDNLFASARSNYVNHSKALTFNLPGIVSLDDDDDFSLFLIFSGIFPGLAIMGSNMFIKSRQATKRISQTKESSEFPHERLAHFLSGAGGTGRYSLKIWLLRELLSLNPYQVSTDLSSKNLIDLVLEELGRKPTSELNKEFGDVSVNNREDEMNRMFPL